MRIFNDFNSYLPQGMKSVVTIGNFDGVHRGHSLILSEMQKVKKKKDLISIIISFKNHTRSVLDDNYKKNKHKFLILTFKEKYKRFYDYNIDYLFNLTFDQHIKNMTYTAFLDLICSRLNIDTFISSDKLIIGSNRDGNADKMKAYFKKNNIDFQMKQSVLISNVCPDCNDNDSEKSISSSAIRKMILSADFKSASCFLGYDYYMAGKVAKGKQLGQSIGFPTINIIPSKYQLCPPEGVYITETVVEGKKYPSVSFLGRSRVHAKDEPGKIKLESYLLNFSKSVYNTYVEVKFINFIRNNKVITSINELKALIAKDVENTKKYFKIK